MKIDLLNMEKIINVNKLQQVTSPKIFSNNKTFHPDGILSNEIFGISKSDRRGRFGYMDLAQKFLHPHVYEKVLKRTFLAITNIVTGQKKFIVQNGVISENENGWTGLSALYKHWNEIDWKKLGSSNERNITLLSTVPKDLIFVDKFLLIPPAYRDIMIGADGAAADNISEINSIYTKIINAIDLLKSGGLFSNIQFSTQAKVQELLSAIYEFFKKTISKKSGLIRNYLLGKNTSFASRVVISAPQYNYNRYEDGMLDINSTLTPISVCCSCYYPFIVAWFKNYFTKNIVNNNEVFTTKFLGEQGWEIKDPETQFNEKYVKKLVNNYMINPDERFNLIKVTIKNKKTNETKDVTLRLKGKKILPNNAEEVLNRDLTVTDLLYIACVDVAEKRYIYISRYPIGIDKSLRFFKNKVNSTIKKIHLVYNGKDYPFYPDIDLSIPKDQVGIQFIDTQIYANPHQKIMSGDYDGDQIQCKAFWSDEANAEIDKLVKSKKLCIDAEGKPTYTIEGALTDALFALTREVGGRDLTPEEQKAFLTRDIKDYTLDFLTSTFAKCANSKDRIGNHKTRFVPSDRMTVPANYFYANQPAIKTTLGRFIFNKFVLATSGVIEKTKFYETTFIQNEIGKIMEITGIMLVNDVITKDQFDEFVNRIICLGGWLSGMITGTISLGTLKPNPKIEAKKEELLKKYEKEVAAGDKVIIKQIENELVDYAKEVLKDDDMGMMVYNSGQINFSNNYKNNFIAKGMIYDSIDKKYKFIRSSLSDGINVEEIPNMTNGTVHIEYTKTIKIADSGYMGKRLMALLQMMQAGEPGSDCGSKNYIPILVSKRNKFDMLQTYIKGEGDNLVLLTPENIDNYIGKVILARSPMACLSPDKICNKCLGEFFYKMDIENLGTWASTINYRFLTYNLKLKHDATIKLTELNPDNIIESF